MSLLSVYDDVVIVGEEGSLWAKNESRLDTSQDPFFVSLEGHPGKEWWVSRNEPSHPWTLRDSRKRGCGHVPRGHPHFSPHCDPVEEGKKIKKSRRHLGKGPSKSDLGSHLWIGRGHTTVSQCNGISSKPICGCQELAAPGRVTNAQLCSVWPFISLTSPPYSLNTQDLSSQDLDSTGVGSFTLKLKKPEGEAGEGHLISSFWSFICLSPGSREGPAYSLWKEKPFKGQET